MQAALAIKGLGEAPVTPPAEENSGQPGTPVDAAPDASKIAPPSEGGENQTQETQGETGKAPVVEGEKPAEAKPDEERTRRGNFRSKFEKLEREKFLATEALEAERDKRRQEVEALRAEIAALKPPAEEKPAAKDELVKPKFPTKADAEYDEDKHEQMLIQYQEDLGEYYRKVAAREADDRFAKRDAEDQERKAKEAQAEADEQFRKRVAADVADLPDFKELQKELGEAVKLPEHVEAKILKSKRPALLIRHFMLDALEEGGEIARLAAMDPYDQVSEMTLLEARLVAEHKKSAEKPPAEPAVVVDATKPPETPPAKPSPRVARNVDPPITPVGSRSGKSSATLESAKSMKDYVLARRAGVNRV